MPIISEPLSPMNIFDSRPNTLWKKNGISAPAVTAASTVMVPSNESMKAVPNTMQAITQNPEASPSTPSIMFMALMMPTPVIAQSGAERYTGNIPTPKAPWKSFMFTWSIHATKPMKAISSMMRSTGLSPIKSSSTPIYIITVRATTDVKST